MVEKGLRYQIHWVIFRKGIRCLRCYPITYTTIGSSIESISLELPCPFLHTHMHSDSIEKTPKRNSQYLKRDNILIHTHTYTNKYRIIVKLTSRIQELQNVKIYKNFSNELLLYEYKDFFKLYVYRKQKFIKKLQTIR